jgi:ribosomal protein S18 acetylase RimI-like enzyme
MKIRQASLSDVEEVAELFDAYRQFYKQASDIKLAQSFLRERIMNNESVIFVCYEGSKAVGFTQLYPIFSSVTAERSWLLNDLYVIAEMRGKGYGEAILRYTQGFCKGMNAKGLALETANDNLAQHLYEKLGWGKDESFLHYFWKA